MIFLLDTDTLVFMVRGLKPRRPREQRRQAVAVVKHCRQKQSAGELVGVSAVTVCELEYGAHKSDDYDAEITAVRKVLTPFRIFDFDGVACPAHYGKIRRELEAQGTPIGSMDLLIAAHALALDATLVTSNLAHFARVTGLTTATWLPP